MALSEYMPYGAPELLDAAPERMARSTMLASLGVALLVVSFGAVLSRQVVPLPEIPVEPDRYEWFDLLEPPPSPRNVPPQVEPASPPDAIDSHSIPVMRPDEVVPQADLTRIATPDGRTGDGPVDGHTPPAVSPCLGDAADPLPDQFVFTDEMPALVRSVEPRYPDLAREAGVEGVVTVRMLVGLDGRVLRAIIAPRGSVLLLDEAALEAARRCVFTPALASGHPVKVWVSQQYRFRLH